MTYAEFSDNGYNYLDKYNNILFSADNTHNYLFDYVATNLSDLSEVFEQYITKRIDTSDFGLRKYKNGIEDINKIKEILISAHPYYEYEYKKTIIKAIGNYFNKLLLYSVFTQDTLPFDYTIKENWYIEKLHILIPSSMVAGNYPNGLSPFDFYHQYKIWIGDRGYSVGEIEESLIPNVPRQMPIGFSEELLIQKNIWDLILHISTQPLRDLENNDITSTKLPSSYEPESLDIVGSGIYANMLYPNGSVFVRGKTISTNNIYEINNLQELLYLEIWNMVQSKTEIKSCENCGKYFKLATPISNGGLIVTPPGSITGSARGGFAITISTGCLRWRLFYFVASPNLSFSSCSRI